MMKNIPRKTEKQIHELYEFLDGKDIFDVVEDITAIARLERLIKSYNGEVMKPKEYEKFLYDKFVEKMDLVYHTVVNANKKISKQMGDKSYSMRYNRKNLSALLNELGEQYGIEI